jgi:hypothetical protein
MDIFKKVINSAEIFNIQSKQREDRLLIEGTIPANGCSLFKVSVSNDGHFLSQFLTGKYTTLATVNNVTVDTGVSYLRGLIRDQGTNKPLFNDFIPLDLFCSPGRMKSDLSTTLSTDPAASPLFYHYKLEHLFTINSDISIEVKNDSNQANKFSICFHGIRIYK